MPRRLLNRHGGVISVYRIFLVDDGLEIDEVTPVEITRRRVYFDEVLALTYHQRIGKAFLAVTLIFMSLMLVPGLAAVLTSSNAAGGLWVSLALASPFVLAILFRVIVHQDVITVFGRRGRAELRFSLRKGMARRTWAELSEAVAATQAASPPLQTP